MKRNSIQVGETFLTLNSKLIIVSRSEYILTLCASCGYRKSSFVIDASLDRNTWEFLAGKLNQLPKCQCSEVQHGSNGIK